jgi:DNA polymerase-3 subunit delta'
MSFAALSGHSQSVQLLQRSLERGRLGHAYLFTGDSLDELEAVAATLAKTLNCQQPTHSAGGVAIDCCGHCLTCRKIADANHADVQWVRPESKSRVITVDQMRDLMQTIYLKPTEADYKVAVIVAADRLNVQAANAFLKTLEEPPPRSLLILLSTEPQQLLETILSRCLRLSFASGSGAKFNPGLLAWLDTFAELAAAGKNGLLGRYQLLGLLLQHLGQLKEGIEHDLTARSPLERYDDVDPKLREKWEDELTAAIESEYRRRRTEVMACLQWWLRDLWLQKLAAAEDLVSFPQLVQAARSIAPRISLQDALDNLQVLEKLQRLLATNVQEALAVEVSLLKLKL